MKGTDLALQLGDSFVISPGLGGVAVLRNGIVVAQNAQLKPSVNRTPPVEVLAQRETRANYSKYISQINKIIGTLDPFRDYQKDLKPKGANQLKTALALCNEALNYGHEPASSQLSVQNLRLGIYYRKALIEYNLNPDDASYAIATINQGLKEITNSTLVQGQFKKPEQDIFANYQRNLSRQRERYMAGIDVEQVIKLAAEYFTQHDQPRAIATLEEALLKRGDIADRDLSFKSVLQLVNKLVEFSFNEKNYIQAQSYIEFGLDIITRLKSESQSVQETTSLELESFARSVPQAYGNAQSHQSAALLQKLKDKFPLNLILAQISQKANDKENDPIFQLAKVDILKRQGKRAEAALLAIKQAPRFLDQVKSSEAAINLWLEKAHGEFQLLMPDELVLSLKTVLGAGFTRKETKLPNFEDRVKRNYLLFAAGNYQDVLENARQFIKDTNGYKNEFRDLREHSFWLEFQSLNIRRIPVGKPLQNQIEEEFPDSILLNSLIH